MVTKQQIIDDIILEVYQGNSSDDDNLSKTQVAYWVGVDLNAFVANEINEKLKRQEMVPAVYVKIATLEPLGLEDNSSNDCLDRLYVELDEEILTVNKDMGIVRCQTDEGQQILRATTETLDIINLLRFAKPSNENLVYSHQDNRIYIEGLKSVDIPFEFINVFYVPKQDVLAMDDEDELRVSDLTLPLVIQSVVARAKAEIYGGQEDKANNGVSDAQPIYHQQIKNTDQ